MDIKAYARSFHQREVPEFVGEPGPVVSPTVSYEPEKKPGYIYYAGDGNGRIKIGFSANPWSRVKEMRCANPSIVILVTEKVDDGLKIERDRHNEFREYHLALEWFSTGERLITWINHLRDNVGRGNVRSNPPCEMKYLVKSGHA